VVCQEFWFSLIASLSTVISLRFKPSCPKNLTAKQATAYESIAPTRDIMELMYERGVLTDAEQEFEPHPLQLPNLPGTE